jgi:hypothetical protein
LRRCRRGGAECEESKFVALVCSRAVGRERACAKKWIFAIFQKSITRSLTTIRQPRIRRHRDRHRRPRRRPSLPHPRNFLRVRRQLRHLRRRRPSWIIHIRLHHLRCATRAGGNLRHRVRARHGWTGGRSGVGSLRDSSIEGEIPSSAIRVDLTGVTLGKGVKNLKIKTSTLLVTFPQVVSLKCVLA